MVTRQRAATAQGQGGDNDSPYISGMGIFQGRQWIQSAFQGMEL